MKYHATYYCAEENYARAFDAESFEEACEKATKRCYTYYPDYMGIDHNPVHRIKITDESGAFRNYVAETKWAQNDDDHGDDDEEEVVYAQPA
jgi:hypothetical protein